LKAIRDATGVKSGATAGKSGGGDGGDSGSSGSSSAAQSALERALAYKAQRQQQQQQQGESATTAAAISAGSGNTPDGGISSSSNGGTAASATSGAATAASDVTSGNPVTATPAATSTSSPSSSSGGVRSYADQVAEMEAAEEASGTSNLSSSSLSNSSGGVRSYADQVAEMAAALAAREADPVAQQQKQKQKEGEGKETEDDPDIIEVEIVTRDGIIKRRTKRSEMEWGGSGAKGGTAKPGGLPTSAGSGGIGGGFMGNPGIAGARARSAPSVSPLSVSGADFLGLGFQEEREKLQGRGKGPLPAGLQGDVDFGAATSAGGLPQVEMIVGSRVITKRGEVSGEQQQQGEGEGGAEGGGKGSGEGEYKPKVATWGVFPRPRDISRTYGGGRTIRPGEALETEEEKKEREEKTRRLLDEYNRRMGFKMDPAVKAACEEAMREGAALMEGGKLRDALQQFDVVIAKTTFQNEMHGRAAIQKAVCLDSLARSDEAKAMYERLTGHPNEGVKRKARQMLFGFQAAESLRFTGGSDYDSSWYKKYFDEFAKGSKYNNVFKATQEDEDESNKRLLQDALLFGALLLMPVVLILAVAVSRNTA
ncbi:hypothetical protein CLOM_g3691, partial [Closterium sp. NIES-68]